MKQILLLVVFISFSFSVFSKEKGEKLNDVYRSQFHFSTETNRMSSPIAFTQIDTVYHLFYQYNPFSMKDGFVNWGHATSTDLVRWNEQEMAIKQADASDSMQNTPWWGSVVASENGLTAWVNIWGDGIYRMKSTDGNNWGEKIKTTGTEKLNQSESFVCWHQPTKKWVMFCYDRPNSSMSILRSTDGLAWEQISAFHYNFGFPQFFEIPVDRKSDDTRWVLFTENGTYLIGTFDGEKFQLSSSVQKFNISKTVGGSVIYNDMKNDRLLMITELKNDPQADTVINGQLSVVNELTLHQTESGIELHLKPVSELSKQMGKPKRFEAKKVYPGINNNILKGISGTEISIKGVIDVKNSDQFGFLLRTDRDKSGTEINFNMRKNNLSLLGTNFDFKTIDNKIEVEILIDRSLVEVYINGGKYVVSSSFAPDPKATRYELFTMGGEIYVEWMEVTDVYSVLHPEK